MSAARRRLKEELGIDAELHKAYFFTYTAQDPESGLTEKELDHVLIGRFDGIPQPHPDEIDEIRWISPADLEQELAGTSDDFAPWFRLAMARMSSLQKLGLLDRQQGETPADAARDSTKNEKPGFRARWRRRFGPKSAIVAAVLCILFVFLSSIHMRAPWRGHLAKGDHWVTGQALRWLRTWHRDGAWATNFGLVLSPPTDEYQGEQKILKWALPGHLMLVHAVATILRRNPDVRFIMSVNLGIHLTLAVLLALLAYRLSILTRPADRSWALLYGTFCGVFVLWFPPILYWGQNLSCQYFSVLPLLVFCVAGRWLRSSIVSPVGQRVLDSTIAVAVIVGTMTDFLFWLLIPYLICARKFRAWKGRPRTSDPWKRTLLQPYVGAMVFLFYLFVVNGQFTTMLGRAMQWTIGGGGLFVFFATRIWYFVVFATGHFYGAFGWLGLFCVGLAFFMLVWRRRMDGLPWMARGIILDLLFPCLLFTFILSPHQAIHTISAMKYIPFVALMWTFATPFTISLLSRRRMMVFAAAYGYMAFVNVWPGNSGYQRYFPVPETAWEHEADFLHQSSRASDILFSPSTAINIFPPQRIALAERAVHHVYGPLDVLHLVEGMPAHQVLGSYAPEELHYTFGADHASVFSDGDFSMARFTVGQFRSFMSRRPDAVFRRHISEVLTGALTRDDDEALTPHKGGVAAPSRPAAMHMYPIEELPERLYWADERHFHAVTSGGRRTVIGEKYYREVLLGLWGVTEQTLERETEWGAFLIGLFDQVEAKARAGAAWRFEWRGYDVIRIPVDSTPAFLQDRTPSVERWDVYLVFKDSKPIAVAAGPESDDDKVAKSDGWIAVVFDDVVSEIRPPDISGDWKIRKHPSDSVR